jgi:amidase
MNLTDIAFTSALEQAQLIRTRQISPLELTQLYLNRIEQYNSQLGSFFYVAAEAAITEATHKTEQLAKFSNLDQLPPFFGIPTAIKDLNPVAGMPCSYGVDALKNQVVDYDDGVVSKIKQAGFIILGKTATSELGSFPYSEAPGFPPARNPWHLDYTAGGSSGGAAAAVAAGLSAVAQGSDGGGSIRGPACCCGVVGIKPARGRVSHAPLGDHQSGIATNGPLARTVRDAAALLDVMSGYITGDPYWLPEPDISFLEGTNQTLPQLRIAFATAIAPFGQAEPACRQGVIDTVKRLEEMGHTIEEDCFQVQELILPFKKIWQAGITASGIPLELLSPLNRWLGEQVCSAGEYLQAVQQMHLISRQIVGFFRQYDLLVLPVYLHPTIKVGDWENLSPPETIERIINWVAPCPPLNASGLPGITLPVGFDKNGLPIGVQLVGRAADEMTIIAVAAQLEQINPWHHHRPYNDIAS